MSEPDRQNRFLTFLSRLAAEGSGEEPHQKIERKRFWSGGRRSGSGAGGASFVVVRAPQGARESASVARSVLFNRAERSGNGFAQGLEYSHKSELRSQTTSAAKPREKNWQAKNGVALQPNGLARTRQSARFCLVS